MMFGLPYREEVTILSCVERHFVNALPSGRNLMMQLYIERRVGLIEGLSCLLTTIKEHSSLQYRQ